jgi:hypothetical protein
VHSLDGSTIKTTPLLCSAASANARNPQRFGVKAGEHSTPLSWQPLLASGVIAFRA